jgi:DNA-binding Xre family transcriptional regulator
VGIKGVIYLLSYRGLREKVIESGLRWQDVKNEIGVSNDVIAKINRNDYITLRSLERFAEYFKCDIGDLVEIRR